MSQVENPRMYVLYGVNSWKVLRPRRVHRWVGLLETGPSGKLGPTTRLCGPEAQV